MIEQIVSFMGDPRVVLGAVAVLALIVAMALRHYARPRIGYRCYKDPRHFRLWRFLVHNLEPVEASGDLVLVLEADGHIDRVEIFAGSYISPTITEQPEERAGRLRFTFRGFPAEAVFTLVVKTELESGEPSLYVDESLSEMRPRRFGKLGPFTRWHRVRYFLPRWSLGFVVSLISFGVGLGIVGGGLSGTDLVCLVMLFVASIVIIALAVPVTGKETVQGYLGWDGSTVVWKREDD